MKAFLKNFRNQLIFGSFVFLSAAVGYAVVTIPNTFTAGTSASADQVNENFAALKTAVDALEARLDGLGSNPPMPSASGILGYATISTDGSTVSNSFNSSGGAITSASPHTTGLYAITFAGLGNGTSQSGNIQVTITDITTALDCRALDQSITPFEDVEILIGCFDSVGSSVDASTSVVYMR